VAIKRITCPYSQTGLVVYCIVRREVDKFLLDDADGSFRAAPADPYLSMPEDSSIRGRYEVDEDRTVWDDGKYTAVVYKQTGGSSIPAADVVIGAGEFDVSNNGEVTLGPVAIDVTFIKSIEGGRWRIVGNQMIFFGEDNVTEIARFNLLDGSGFPTQESPLERVRV